MEVVTFRVKAAVVGLVFFSVVVDSFVDVHDVWLAFFNVVMDFCVVFDVAVDPCVDVVDVCLC